MKMKIKAILLICLLVVALCVVSGCSKKTIFEEYDDDGYTVSIRFDANGGTMMEQVPAIVDTFNIKQLTANSNGEVEIPLLDPTDSRRGNANVCKPKYTESGYYLAGWCQRTENPDGEGYVYSEPWNFESDRVSVKADKSYSSSEPVLTLYAVWKPLLNVEIYDRSSNELKKTLSYDPTKEQIEMPKWKKDGTGAISMFEFPEKEGYTFYVAYYDSEGTQPITTEFLIHTAQTNPDATTMKIYVDWLEGEWYHIYNAKQLTRNADPNGKYVICDNLNFEDVTWPTVFMDNKFTGTIQTLDNQQFTLSGIKFAHDREMSNAGLFGWIEKDASISNITFKDVEFTVKKGTTRTCKLGLFSSSISMDASIENVSITGSKMIIDLPEMEEYGVYIVGLVCAEGNTQCLTQAEITCSSGENDFYTVSVDGNTVTIEKK